MREHIEADEPFAREDVPVGAGARALPRRGPGLQGRADRGPGPRTERRRDRLALHQRPVHRPLPRPARAEHQAHRRVQAAVGGRRLLARRRQPPDAHARLRHRLLQARPSSTRTSSSSSRRGRATTASSAASSGCSRSRALSPGSTFWLPKGTAVFNALVALNRRMQQERGYVEVKTPLLYESQLWETSGHWGKYKDNIFVSRVRGPRVRPQADELPGPLRTCSGCSSWSYRDLPVATPSPGLLHRREPSGTLHGLLRVRHFIQDDAHIFCTEDQIQDEVAQMPGLRLRDLRHVRLPGARRALDAARRTASATTSCGTTPRGRSPRRSRPTASSTRSARARAPSTGPKIDLHMTDSLGRSWQLGTVQLDYNMPERFELTYTGADNAEHTPGDDPPRAVRLLRALHRDPASSTPPASCRCGWRPCRPSRCRSPTATTTPPRRPSPRCARPACAPRSTTAPSRSGARSATPSCRRSPTCSSSATARPRRAPSRVRRHGEGDEGTVALGEFVERLAGEVARAEPAYGPNSPPHAPPLPPDEPPEGAW